MKILFCSLIVFSFSEILEYPNIAILTLTESFDEIISEIGQLSVEQSKNYLIENDEQKWELTDKFLLLGLTKEQVDAKIRLLVAQSEQPTFIRIAQALKKGK